MNLQLHRKLPASGGIPWAGMSQQGWNWKSQPWQRIQSVGKTLDWARLEQSRPWLSLCPCLGKGLFPKKTSHGGSSYSLVLIHINPRSVAFHLKKNNNKNPHPSVINKILTPSSCFSLFCSPWTSAVGDPGKWECCCTTGQCEHKGAGLKLKSTFYIEWNPRNEIQNLFRGARMKCWKWPRRGAAMLFSNMDNKQGNIPSEITIKAQKWIKFKQLRVRRNKAKLGMFSLRSSLCKTIRDEFRWWGIQMLQTKILSGHQIPADPAWRKHSETKPFFFFFFDSFQLKKLTASWVWLEQR